MDISPSRPLLVLERKSSIDSLELREDLTVVLTDDSGRPVDRSVVALQLFSPDGRGIDHYCGNIDIIEEKGQFEIPFALNDPNGSWRVEARDVISGLVSGQTVRRDTAG
jgi:hypothetical protein